MFQITNRYGDVPIIEKDNGGGDEDCEEDDRTHCNIGSDGDDDEDDGYDVAVCTLKYLHISYVSPQGDVKNLAKKMLA